VKNQTKSSKFQSVENSILWVKSSNTIEFLLSQHIFEFDSVFHSRINSQTIFFLGLIENLKKNSILSIFVQVLKNVNLNRVLESTASIDYWKKTVECIICYIHNFINKNLNKEYLNKKYYSWI